MLDAGKYGPVALVLGGSEGIGRKFAEEIAAAGMDLVLVARNRAPLDQAAAELHAAYPVRVTALQRDLTAPGFEDFLDGILREHDIGLAVCNAGATHGVGHFLDGDLARAESLVQLNCNVPLVIAHKVLRARRAARRGAGLVVVSSMSGVCGSGLVAAYAAAKSFQIALCEGLHWELAGQGLDVLCAVAGLTDTPAMRRSGVSFTAAAAAGYLAMDAAHVAKGALGQLGRMAVWYSVGQQTADAMRAMPRPQLTQAMSAGSAALFQVPARTRSD
jgi:short-subunit dehydrogenase